MFIVDFNVNGKQWRASLPFFSDQTLKAEIAKKKALTSVRNLEISFDKRTRNGRALKFGHPVGTFRLVQEQ